MAEPSDQIHTKITGLCEQGDREAETKNYEQAVLCYQQALELVPEPKTDWEAATWIYTALGDAYWLMKRYSEAKNCFFDQRNCPDGITNPFILLRIGQSCAELNKIENAKEYLLQAAMLKGEGAVKAEGQKYYGGIEPLMNLGKTPKKTFFGKLFGKK